MQFASLKNLVSPCGKPKRYPKKELMYMKDTAYSPLGQEMVFLDRSKGLHGSVPKGALSGPPLNSHIGYKRPHGLLHRQV